MMMTQHNLKQTHRQFPKQNARRLTVIRLNIQTWRESAQKLQLQEFAISRRAFKL